MEIQQENQIGNENKPNQGEQDILHLFKRQTSAFITIIGRRGAGKTDFSLRIAETLFNYNVIKHIASNIRIYDSPFPITYITDLQTMESWAKDKQGKKLYILDEAGKSLMRRTPMSRMNLSILQKVQVMRKYKLSLIFCTINMKLIDSGVITPDIMDGYFVKPKFDNPKIALYYDWLQNYDFRQRNIPATLVHFDSSDSALLTDKPETIKPLFKEEDLSILWDWSHGTSLLELKLNPKTINVKVRKFIRRVLESGLYHLPNTKSEVNVNQSS